MNRAVAIWFVVGAGLGAIMALEWIPLEVGGGLAVVVVIGLGLRDAAKLPLTREFLARVGGHSSGPSAGVASAAREADEQDRLA